MQVYLKIEIESGNAAFGRQPFDAAAELARILRVATRDFMENPALSGRWELRDVNGNVVGFLDYTIKEEDDDDAA